MNSNMIPIVMFIVIAIIVKIVSDNRTRRQLIENSMLNENVKYLFSDPFERHIPSSLKWGMVMIAVGIALLTAQFLPHQYENEITLAMVLIMAGIALLIFYGIGTRKLKDEMKQKIHE